MPLGTGGSQVHGDPQAARTLQLLGLEVSLFTAKARAYLIWKGIPFEEVVVTEEIMKKIIIPRAGWNVVPVALDNDRGVCVQDTAEIIDYFDIKFPGNNALPSIDCPRQRFVCYLLELFADQWLVLPAMHYRWSFPEQRGFIAYEFSRSLSSRRPGDMSDQITADIEKTVMKRFGGSLPFLGVNQETIPAIETWYCQLIDAFNEHLKWHHYLLGGRPTLADFAFMGPFFGHLCRDPIPYQLTRLRAPRVVEWVERCNQRTTSGGERFHAVNVDGTLTLPAHSTDVLDGGALFPHDCVPETLLPILQLVFDLQVPELLDTVHMATKFLKDHPDNEEVPRSFGPHSFTMCGVTSQRMAMSFDLWKAQRVIDEIARCQRDGAANEVKPFIAQFGENAMNLYNLDMSGCRLKRVPGTKSHGNNLYKDPSGTSPSMYLRSEFHNMSKL